MQTSARRPNIEARGRGVVRWLPWVAYLLQELGWIKTATHETRLPGLPDGIPVQVRQNVADHRWYVVSNAGVWGLTGFRTAERAEGYAQHIVIDPDGQEYRRARRNPVEDMPPSQRHGRDEPDPRPPSELYLAVVAAARLEYGPGTAARIASMVTEYNVRIDAIDRAYAAGDEAAVEANAGRAEELRIELVGLYHELEFGQEDYTDAEANAETQSVASNANARRIFVSDVSTSILTRSERRPGG